MLGRSRVFRLAHISDLHIAPLPPVALRDLWGKRLLGYFSCRWRRHRAHRQEVLAALRRDLWAIEPDHIVVTGDLVNIALPAEFAQAAAWLRALGDPQRISVIPGNHDALIRIAHGESLGHWADYMASDETGAAHRDCVSGFPYLRRRGPIALIGLSTAIATPPGFATGRLGRPQLEALDRLLATLACARCCRVVLLHHSPLTAVSGWRRRLVDAAAFRKIVRRRGADLILHGHEHVPIRGEIPGPHGPIPVAGVPSASSLDSRPERRARYQVYDVESAAGGWAWASQSRSYDPARQSFAELPSTPPAAQRGRESSLPC
jgi:3',5'-cyclic AMP phosphodiesterase CpdA